MAIQTGSQQQSAQKCVPVYFYVYVGRISRHCKGRNIDTGGFLFNILIQCIFKHYMTEYWWIFSYAIKNGKKHNVSHIDNLGAAIWWI